MRATPGQLTTCTVEATKKGRTRWREPRRTTRPATRSFPSLLFTSIKLLFSPFSKQERLFSMEYNFSLDTPLRVSVVLSLHDSPKKSVHRSMSGQIWLIVDRYRRRVLYSFLRSIYTILRYLSTSSNSMKRIYTNRKILSIDDYYRRHLNEQEERSNGLYCPEYVPRTRQIRYRSKGLGKKLRLLQIPSSLYFRFGSYRSFSVGTAS